MMSLSWRAPVTVLTDRADAEWTGIWSLTYAAGLAAATLAALPGADEDLRLTYAALDANQALAEIEAAHPGVPSSAAAIDLGTPAAADAAAAVEMVVELLDAAIGRVSILSATAGLPVGDLLCLARVQPLLLTARAKAAGGAW